MILEKILDRFGLELKTPKETRTLESIEIEKIDGAKEIPATQAGIFSFVADYYSVPKTEIDQLKTCRNLATVSEVERALNEIYNEVLIFDSPDKRAIEIDFYFGSDPQDEKKVSDKLMKKIRKEYHNLYNLLDFQKRGLKLFSQFYVDGKLFLQKIIDKNKPKDGIQKVIRIDPMKIKRVVEYPQPSPEGVYDLAKIKIYFVYSDTINVYGEKANKCLIINNDVIAYTDSGIYDQETGMVLSYLWKTIIPYNNMKLMQDSLIVYRVVRSPERRVFYISVGNLSKPKAEQYIKELMTKFKNKLVYDIKSGSISDRKNVLSMVEDYWLPRRDDGKGTEITTLPGASNIGEITDVELFRKIFLESLNVPVSRFKDDQTSLLSFGRSNTEINQEEYRFKKFLDRLRNNFVVIFEDLLRTQLILKNIITSEDWDDIKESILWIYAEDNNFVEWKESEILNSKLQTLQQMDSFVGKYFSKQYILKKIFKMSDDEIEDILEDAENSVEPQQNQIASGENQQGGDEDSVYSGEPEEIANALLKQTNYDNAEALRKLEYYIDMNKSKLSNEDTIRLKRAEEIISKVSKKD